MFIGELKNIEISVKYRLIMSGKTTNESDMTIQ